jgi:hypothetical protein
MASLTLCSKADLYSALSVIPFLSIQWGQGSRQWICAVFWPQSALLNQASTFRNKNPCGLKRCIFNEQGNKYQYWQKLPQINLRRIKTHHSSPFSYPAQPWQLIRVIFLKPQIFPTWDPNPKSSGSTGSGERVVDSFWILGLFICHMPFLFI